MRAGAKDRKITVQVKTVSRSPSGEVIETWADVARLWAQRLEGAKALERYAAQQTLAQVTMVFRTSYFPALSTIQIKPDAHRVLFGNMTFNILGAIEIGRKDGAELICCARAE